MSIVRTIALCSIALSLAGCAALRGEKKDEDRREKTQPRYRLEVDAPRPLRQILAEHLDLARFRQTPESEPLDSVELDRLVAMAPEQAKVMLATEGYFNAQVQASREEAAAGELPLVVVRVEPGPRTLIESFEFDVEGDLAQRAQAGERDAQALLNGVRDDWLLKPGKPFRQQDWTASKDNALGRLHADGYPTATWIATEARVRSRDQRADLEAHAQSGPLFFFGPTRIEGLQRYDERVVRNVATYRIGTPYSEKRLLDYQERLVRSGLFQGAVAEIDPDASNAAAAPVTLRVQEQPLQKTTLGLGYSTDTGARATLEHIHRKPFGLRWTARNAFELGPLRKAWEFDYRSWAKPGFRRNILGGELERWSGTDEERSAFRLRAGRSWEDPRLERLAYGEFNHARVTSPTGEERKAQALTANYDWNRREVDSLLLPTRGTALLLQGAVGYSRSSNAKNGPLARAVARVIHFRPLGRDWHATLRAEAGQVFARDNVGVPDTLLFRAGGEESVRGYEYRGLGPVVDGVVTSGKSLFTASAEVARPILERMPQLWGAGFIDAGNAAKRFSDLDPVVGVGVGVRYRSPVGPLKFDVAYGVEDKQVRVHLSAGVAF